MANTVASSRPAQKAGTAMPSRLIAEISAPDGAEAPSVRSPSRSARSQPALGEERVGEVQRRRNALYLVALQSLAQDAQIIRRGYPQIRRFVGQGLLDRFVQSVALVLIWL